MNGNRIEFTGDPASVLADLLKGTDDSMIFAVADPVTAEVCLPRVADALRLCEGHLCIVPEGERAKSLVSAEEIWKMFSSHGARRDSVVVNVGGGVVTDLGGFAASCYKRGMRCINIPTTLLSQVDASVGGKTGINFCGFKNEIGTFSVPEYVIIDNSFLETLPHSQVMSGYAEMLKHALLDSFDFLRTMMSADTYRVSDSSFLPLLRESVAVKERIVNEDPLEKGVRKALNLGHTAGHAIESFALARGAEWNHGYSVAYGLVVAMYLSVGKTGFNEDICREVSDFIYSNYPPFPVKADTDRLYELMLHDKKNEGCGVNFTLLRAPGDFVVNCHCTETEVKEALERLRI